MFVLKLERHRARVVHHRIEPFVVGKHLARSIAGKSLAPILHTCSASLRLLEAQGHRLQRLVNLIPLSRLHGDDTWRHAERLLRPFVRVVDARTSAAPRAVASWNWDRGLHTRKWP